MHIESEPLKECRVYLPPSALVRLKKKSLDESLRLGRRVGWNEVLVSLLTATDDNNKRLVIA
jgi:hypothetical protein